jgi:hypothetical protein
LLVSTSGLTGGDASTPTDAGSQGIGDATTQEDSGAPTDSSPPADVAVDVPVAQDSSGPEAEASVDSSACAPPTVGLIGYWTMDTDSITGTTLADSSGNNNNGTLVGFTSPETAPGEFGQALVYPASGQAYVQVPNLPLDTTTGDANSISLWFYRNDINVNDVLLLLPNSPRYDLWLTGSPNNSSSDTYLCINTENNECFGIGSATLLGQWVHVVAIFANGAETKGSLYVDGQPAGAACLTAAGFQPCDYSAVAAAPVEFGGETDFFYHGMIDDVRIYNRALTASEVSVLYQCP